MSFSRNVGSIDKTIRLIAGVVLIALAIFMLGINTTPGIIAAVVGAVLLLTGTINFCPLFRILGISSFRP